MPKLFSLMGYVIFFWSNENNEPIHVHVSKKKPHGNATKIWLTSSEQCILENNNDNIPPSDLAKLMEVISVQSFFIREAWKRHFNVDTIRYIK